MKILSLILCICTFSQINAQNLSQHRWQNRLILLLTSDTKSSSYQDQVKLLKVDPKGLKERKLLVYSATPQRFKQGLNKKEWQAGDRFYSRFQREEGFEFLLIGLDGGVKHRQSTVMKLEQLYTLIDGMPMRRAEMNDRGMD